MLVKLAALADRINRASPTDGAILLDEFVDARSNDENRTTVGVLVGLAWPAALAFGAVWLATALATRYSSLAALVASAASPCVLAWLGEWRLAGVFLMLAALLFWQHRSNIERLSKGEETRIGESKA